jgi:peptide/nickel transport system permease protein
MNTSLGRFLKRPQVLIGLAVVAISVIVALAAGVIAPYSPHEFSRKPFASPSAEHPMGTDNMGRDILSRVIWGTRVSLIFAFGTAGVALVVGLFLGALPGYYGGWFDDLVSRFVEFFLVIPRLFLIILVVSIYGSSLWVAVIITGLTSWPSNAKIMRAQVLSLKNRAFVHASIGSGKSSFRVLMDHVIPNGIGPLIANSTLVMAHSVLTEASLSFLGLGDANLVSWGKIIYDGQFHVISAPWIVIFPGICLVFLLLALHLLGDGLAAVLNPRLRGKGELAEWL